MGYVGVPLACAFVEEGIQTIGLDTDESRVADLQEGRPYIDHLEESVFSRLAASPCFEATTKPQALAGADAMVICVPTPLDENHVPDLSPIAGAAAAIADHGRPGRLVVLESTTYPGTTRDVLVPALTGPAAAGAATEPHPEFFIGYSPERLDPGGPADFVATPKLVAGLDDQSTELAIALYESVFADVRPVKDVETAEAAKLLENTFRAVNIALVNELKVAFSLLGIDIWEVISAASSKPFGFMPFYPGPGVGGHCIPIDPEYLAWRSRSRQSPLAITEAAIRINQDMPRYVVDRLAKVFADSGRSLAGSQILIVGVSYKPGVGDVRRSPGLALIEALIMQGSYAAYHDPFVAKLDTSSGQLHSREWEPASVAGFDAAIICTDHDTIDYSLLAASGLLVVDTRNAMARRGFIDLDTILKA
jgi:UDP-N-acetyl-D-glucosamine dehydrogenase